MPEQDAETTPTHTPIAIAIARVESKIDEGFRSVRSDIADISKRTDRALEYAFAAHQASNAATIRADDARQTARAAMWMHNSWGPYLVSAIALGLAIVAACR